MVWVCAFLVTPISLIDCCILFLTGKLKNNKDMSFVFVSRMAGLSHGGAGGSSDFSRKKSQSLDPSGENRSGMTLASGTTSLTVPKLKNTEEGLVSPH